ncbi:MAG: 23S rRNA (guanosine(2251)-2'-O)-methyltransferase RlmB [Syntrophobacteraceae bacterium]
MTPARPQPPRKKPSDSPPILICGINPVKEALRAVSLVLHEMILARSDQRAEEVLALAAARNVPIRRESRETLTSLSGHAHHQGVLLFAASFPYTDFNDLMEGPLSERDPLVLLDSVQDPQNLGALMRSACFLGAKGIILPKDRSVRVTGTVIRIASGATAYLPVVEVTNLGRAIEGMKDKGYWIVGLDVRGDRPIHAVDLTVPLALVVGSEQKGMRPLIARCCDFLVSIPSGGPLESLNAATAGAVALAEVLRQRLKATAQS